MKACFLIVLSLFFVVTHSGCEREPVAIGKPVDPLDGPSMKVDENSTRFAKEYVIDVRSQEEWNDWHLDNAILIPHDQIAEKIGTVTEDKSAKLVLY